MLMYAWDKIDGKWGEKREWTKVDTEMLKQRISGAAKHFIIDIL